MISADQCVEAAELLTDREELVGYLVFMMGATHFRIEFGRSADLRSSSRTNIREVSDAVRKLLQADVEAKLLTLDEKLRALGVTPPALPAEEVAA